MTKRITILMDDELVSRLDTLGNAGTTRSDIIRELINQRFNEREARYYEANVPVNLSGDEGFSDNV